MISLLKKWYHNLRSRFGKKNVVRTGIDPISQSYSRGPVTYAGDPETIDVFFTKPIKCIRIHIK